MAAPIGPDASRVTSDANQIAAEIDISSLATRLETEAMRLINDYSQQGLEGEALANAVEAGLRALSDTPVDRAARGAASESFNLGRNIEAQANADKIERVVRVEILDENTCGPCRSLDGQVYDVNTDAYFENMPPNKCDGRDYCRGFYMYEVS